VGFPDNYSAGLSFLHNVFAREHNIFVEAFRAQARARTRACAIRQPRSSHQLRRRDGRRAFEVARLVVAAEIAKIHTIEWTTQLLYDEPLYLGMNANWTGLFEDESLASKATAQVIENSFGPSGDPKKSTQWYSIFAGGSGIVGLGSHHYEDGAIFAHYDPKKTDRWTLTDEADLMRGVNHFGSPFNFPEEFVTVYRLHPLIPDLIELRRLDGDPNAVVGTVPVVTTFRGEATDALRRGGLGNWALSMGRQRLGLLTLQNMPQFLQNLPMKGRLAASPTDRIDVTALDLIRDRSHGLPRFNEFRRQYGLQSLTGFDDFVDSTWRSALSRGRRREGRARAPAWVVKTCATSTDAHLRRVQGHHARSATATARSPTVSAIPTTAPSTTSKTSTWWSACSPSRRVRTATRFRRRSSRSSSSTHRAGCSATAFSPPASAPSSIPSSASTG
jgi:hypothetical protein